MLVFPRLLVRSSVRFRKKKIFLLGRCILLEYLTKYVSELFIVLDEVFTEIGRRLGILR